MNLILLDETLAVCRLPAGAGTPEWLPAEGFVSVTRTLDEVSIVCAEAAVPDGSTYEGGWRGLQVEGPLDFSLTGILSSLAGPLADAGVAVFALSTYDTDYLLVRGRQLGDARQALIAAGHRLDLD